MNSTEIAKIAGVSRATVSRVLNNCGNVTESTKQKVQAVIDRYNYIPNRAAQILVGVPSKIVGFFIFDYNQDHMELLISKSPVLSSLVAYASDIVQQKEYSLILSSISNGSLEQIERLYKNGTISGAMVQGDIVDIEKVNSLADEGCKLVLINQTPFSTHPNVITVNFNDYRDAYQATEKLIEVGHRNIGFLMGSPDKMVVKQRLKGIRTCLENHGIPKQEQYFLPSPIGAMHRIQSGYLAMNQLFDRCAGHLPTGFIANSAMAVGALHSIHEHGLQVPRDFSIIAIDGIDHCNYSVPPLHEIVTPLDKIMEQSVKSLIEFIETGIVKQQDILIESNKYIERESLSPPTR